MKPFDLEAAKNGAPVQTRNGKPARIICYDKKGTDYPVVALVDNDNGIESIRTYPLSGLIEDANLDLVMASTKKEGYIIVYKDGFTSRVKFSAEEALDIGKQAADFVAVAKIEWEE